MGINKDILALDIDDVCWDLVNPWIDRYNLLTDNHVMFEEIKSWDMTHYVAPEDNKLIYEILLHDELWDSIQPLPDSQYYIKQLNNEYDLRFITATKWQTHTKKISRFVKLFPFIDVDKKLITSYDKQIIGVNLLVDDNPDNLINGHYNKILHTRPWNKDFNCIEYGILRANNLEEIYKGIHTLLPID